MDLVSKIVFLFSNKKYLVILDKEGAPELIYRNGDRYLMGGFLINDSTLQIDKSSINRTFFSKDNSPLYSDARIINDLTIHMNKFKIEVRTID